MCVVAAGVAGAAVANATLAIGAISTVASIGMGMMSMNQQAAQAQQQMNLQAQQQERQQQMQRDQMIQAQQHQHQNLTQRQHQNQQAYNMQVAQSNAAMLNQYNQQVRAVQNERASILAQDEANRLTYQRETETATEQKRYNAEAANRKYVEAQQKMSDAKAKAAFAQQRALSKSIGARGRILAAGRTGQSVGLLVNDAERQMGFAMAEQNATTRSAIQAAQIGMDTAFIENQSADFQAQSQVGFLPQDPYLPEMPDAPAFIDGNTFAIA